MVSRAAAGFTYKDMPTMRLFLPIALVVFGLAPVSANAQAAIGPSCDNARFLQDQKTFENSSGRQADLPEHVCGSVVAVSASKRTRSGLHGYFYVDVGSGISIRIVSDLDQMKAPAWPWVAKGDKVDVVGRYYYDNPRSQGIDWTHHGTSKSWTMPGYVTVNGTTYQ